MDTILRRYAPSLFPLLVLIGGVLTAAGGASTATLTDWRTLAQIGILVVTTGASYVLGLLPSGWRGAFKVGAPILGAILSFLLVTITTDWHPTSANVTLVIVGVLKVVATQLGVAIRTDPVKVIDAGFTAEGVPVLTTVGAHDALVDGDGLANPANTEAPPKHSA